MSHVAIVGCGLVGRAWAIVFVRARYSVLLCDWAAGAAEAAIATIERNFADLFPGWWRATDSGINPREG